ANLPFGDTSLVGTTIAVLKPAFRQVLVVTRNRASLPDLGVEVLEDQSSLQGPLVGIARGLAHSDAPWFFVTACDMPFLKTEVITEMALHLTDYDAVIPRHDGRLQTLHAFYSSRCLAVAEEILADGITSIRELVSRCRTKELSNDDLAPHPDGSNSFRDLDTEAEYRDALREALKEDDGPPIS
ncbi:MAG: molybdenum cofactor guanylyltransferase, partial [Chloroflexi bacterium]|nr:molybdenum cofactor guanylyltransferase [Chloroflexota bacterium]